MTDPEFTNNSVLEDELWFDTWEGQIELSDTKKYCETELDFDEFDLERVYSPIIRQKSPSLLRTTSLPVPPAQNNRFHSAHTLFWNLHHDDDEDEEDVRKRELKKKHVLPRFQSSVRSASIRK